MDYKEFKEAFKEDLREALSERGIKVTLSENQVNKLNKSYDALCVTPEGSNVGVNLNVEQLFSAHEEGTSYANVAKGAIDNVETAIGNIHQINVDSLLDYDQMKKNLSMCVVSADRNAKMLDKVPHEKMEDMAVVYRFIVDKREDGNSTVLVTNALLKQFDITHDQLRKDALEIAPEIRPAEIKGMTEMLTEMTGMEVDPSMHEVDDVMFVATVHDKMNGAGVIAYPNFMEDAAEKLGGDYFVLPSSIHEVLLVKDNGSMNVKDLESMVKEVNSTQVEPEDQLTDHVYHYDSKEHLFELADKYEDRLQENAMDEHSQDKNSILDTLKEKKDEVAHNEPKKHIEKAAKQHHEDASL